MPRLRLIQLNKILLIWSLFGTSFWCISYLWDAMSTSARSIIWMCLCSWGQMEFLKLLRMAQRTTTTWPKKRSWTSCQGWVVRWKSYRDVLASEYWDVPHPGSVESQGYNINEEGSGKNAVIPVGPLLVDTTNKWVCSMFACFGSAGFWGGKPTVSS